MNAEIKAKWIAALRSGKYKQAQWNLRVGDDFCCLGVLCDVIGLKPEYDKATERWYFDGRAHYLPGSAVTQARCGGNGALPERVDFGNESYSTLGDLNDAGADFNFIADVIEKQL